MLKMSELRKNVFNLLEANSLDLKKVANSIISTEEGTDTFYVLNLDDIVRKHENILKQMPRIKPFFAVKCNDHDTVLQTLAKLGTGFDCASMEEIKTVLRFDVDPSRIIFANPTKPISHIKFAKAKNVKLLTFDNEEELKKIRDNFPEASLVLRIATGTIFGCEPIKRAPELLKVAKKFNLNVMGLSFHIGQFCTDYQIYEKTLKICKDLSDFAKSIGYQIAVVDIGGGFTGNSNTNTDELFNIINNALETYFPDDNIKIISEPGRYFVASAMSLVSQIQSKRNFYEDNINCNIYYISTGLYSAFLGNKRDLEIPEPIPLNINNQEIVKCIFRGPTCCANDQICEAGSMQNMNVGDWVIFNDKGAYTLTFGFSFNGFPQPYVYPFIGRKNWNSIFKPEHN